METFDDQRYRRQVEDFVSNHGGTTSREVIFAILPNICSIFLTMSVSGLLGKCLHRHIRVILEFFLLIVPCILCCTILSEHLFHVCAVMLILSLIAIILIGVRKSTSSQSTTLLFDLRQVTVITNFRALVNVITAVCILAVDFKVFPRKFAKTEVYGYSLMDTGVGLFIISNALVSPEARGVKSDRKVDFFPGIIKSFKSCIPLLVLGFGRFFAVEYLGYQKHVTEYGVHWNFFITLAFVKLFSSLISNTISSKYSLLSGIWLLAMYEYGLNSKNLKEWILSVGSRNDFISANREGLISIPGYVGLYFIGLAVGRLIHSTYQSLSANSKQSNEQTFLEVKIFKREIAMMYNQSMILCIKLSLIASQACAVTLFCDAYLSVSRRLANAGYCAWIVTLSTTVLTLLLLVEILTDVFVWHRKEDNKQTIGGGNDYAKKVKHHKSKLRMGSDADCFSRSPEIFEAVNYNGLCFFLLANLLTGTVNMFMKTLYTENAAALKILFVYMAVNILFVLVCYRLKVQIKL